jgi:predicted DNA-binding antitoxin AbrB/MazE fold protein
MAITVEAIYENGVLKPVKPLPLNEHEQVEVTVRPKVSVARQTAGMIPWTGDAETLERIACDPEFGILESP